MTTYNRSKKIKYFSINLTKYEYVQDLYAENYKWLMKDIQEDLNEFFP